MTVSVLLTPVSKPLAFPEIGARPFGKGLSIDVIGRKVSCCSTVCDEYPAALRTPDCHGAQKGPDPARMAVLSFRLYAIPNRGDALIFGGFPTYSFAPF